MEYIIICYVPNDIIIMEFSIDIHTSMNGEIIIEDFSKEYNQYLDEDASVVYSYDEFKYSQTASLNAIIKVETKKITLIDVLLDDHTEDLDSVTFHVDADGYYTVDHLILPNMEWYETSSNDYREYYETIYVTDGEKVYKEIDGTLQECTVREILERNIEGTTIQKCRVDVFYTANLQNCYIWYCKQIFENLLNACANGKYNDLLYARDFIWMTLNIIDYLVGFKQFLEAQRILESFQHCGGYCKDFSITKPDINCGCAR